MAVYVILISALSISFIPMAVVFLLERRENRDDH